MGASWASAASGSSSTSFTSTISPCCPNTGVKASRRSFSTVCSRRGAARAPVAPHSRCGARMRSPSGCTRGSALPWLVSGAGTIGILTRMRSSSGAKACPRLPATDLETAVTRVLRFVLINPRRCEMNEQSPEIKALLQTDEEFNQLAAQHHQLEDRLQQLTSKHYLSEPEQVEEITLKKRKLALKDRMEVILRQHRQHQQHH